MRESDGFRAVVEATAEWAMTKTDEFEFTSWEPHSFSDGKARDLSIPFMAFAGLFPTDASQQFMDSAIASGLSADEARQILQGMVNPPQRDDEWRRTLSTRNFRYAVVRDLFERALAAEPAEIATALGDIGLTVLDMHATFDSLAMNAGWPDL